MLVDKSGKPINMKEYRRVSLDPVIATFENLVEEMESDYGNIPGILSKLSEMIQDNCIEGFTSESRIIQMKGTYSFYPDNSTTSITDITSRLTLKATSHSKQLLIQ